MPGNDDQRASIGAWRPSKRQLETLADCVAAGFDTARVAMLLGIDEATFIAWTKRLAAGAAYEAQMAAVGSSSSVAADLAFGLAGPLVGSFAVSPFPSFQKPILSQPLLEREFHDRRL
jgi:hypothetical protein